MKSKFMKQLNELNENLVYMAVQCENGITYTVQSLLLETTELTDTIIQMKHKIDCKELEIQELCNQLLFQQQLSPHERKTINAALQMIIHFECIGNQTADIAKILKQFSADNKKKFQYINLMGDTVMHMIYKAINAFVKKDSKRSQEVISMNNEVNNLFYTIQEEFVGMMCNDTKETCIVAEPDLSFLVIAKHIERISDHIVNIAECVVEITD